MSSTSSSTPWLTGEIFDGHFEIGRLIARGGMAEVYHGVDLWSNNPVAVKVLFPQLSADPSQQQKFFREERSLRQIRHEHVVGVLGSGTQKVGNYELMFIVLDYVHGCTLQQLLAIRPVLSVQEAFEVLLPAVEGLSEVHAHRLIHRDIKPSNVLLSSTEESVKLTDFGLTRRTDQSWTGELMGTPAYVAPEIVDPKAIVGSGVDIFAVGIMMFRMLTGRLPFPGMGDDQQVIYHNVNTEIPSVLQFAPGVHADIAGVIKWCTRKQPAGRPADAAELFGVLTEIYYSLTPEDLEYRADVSDPPIQSLWDAVETVAERTGATKIYSQTSISAFGTPEDVFDPESDEINAAEQYEPTAISGVGPVPDPSSGNAEYFDDLDETFIDENLPLSTSQFQPISAEYRPKLVAPKSAQHRQQQDSVAPPARSHSAPRRAADHRYPDSVWVEPPTTITILLIAVLILFGFVAAGFIGWQLANSVLASAWFQTWTDWFSKS